MAKRRANKSTLADELAVHIRQLILDGKFSLEEDLTEDRLRELLKEAGYKKKWSPHPLRLALAELEKDGLVVIKPRAWTRVRQLDEKELRAICDSRAVLEEFVVCQLARRRTKDLDPAVKVNAAMKEIARLNTDRQPTLEDQRKFVELDVQFHGALTRAAGYGGLTDELERLRRRLHQRVAPRLYGDGPRMELVAKEHDEILAALGYPDGGERPDINRVRGVLRNHLRNSAKRWQIAENIRYLRTDFDRDFIFDLPDVYHGREGSAVPAQHILVMRLALELAAVIELAARDYPDLSTVESLNREMALVASRCVRNGVITPEDRVAFINLDIGYHAALSFLSGLLFTEEGIVYSWKQLARSRMEGLKLDDMPLVVAEHATILNAVSQGSFAAATAIVQHLENSITRQPLKKPFDKSVFSNLVVAMTAGITGEQPIPKKGR